MSSVLTQTQTGITFGSVRNGLQGNYDIVTKMTELTRNTVVFDKGFDAFVKGLISEHGLDSYSDPKQLFDFLYNFVKQHVHYILDATGKVEHLKDARSTLSDGFGDCDDHAVLNASMLAVLGYKPFFVMARYDVQQDTYTHIYTGVTVEGKRYIFDTTLENGELNKEETPVAIKEINVFGYDPNLDGMRGLFNQTSNTIKNLFQTTLQAVPDMLPFLPFGYVASSAFKVGADMLLESDAFGNAVYDKSQYDTVSAINRQLDSIITKLYNSTLSIEQAENYATKQMNRLTAMTVKNPVSEQSVENLKQKYKVIMNFQEVAQAKGINTFNLDGQRILVVGVLLIGAVTVLYFSNKKRY